MTIQVHTDAIANIRNVITNKRERSGNPITKNVARYITLARDVRIKPAKRQEYVKKALALLPQVPETKIDAPWDLAQKLRDEAIKDLNNSQKKVRTLATEAVKTCNRYLASANEDWQLASAGTGPEILLLIEGIRKDVKPVVTANNKGEQIATYFMKTYSKS